MKSISDILRLRRSRKEALFNFNNDPKYSGEKRSYQMGLFLFYQKRWVFFSDFFEWPPRHSGPPPDFIPVRPM